MKEKELCGSLFKADETKKRDVEGSCTIDGKEYWISGWNKVGKSGNTRLSLSFTPKDAKPSEGIF
jgi:hypothetical protein